MLRNINPRTLVCLAALVAASLALAQPPSGPRSPLVPCASAPAGTPCSQVATSAADIVGVWKQFLGNPALQAPGGMGYIRYFADGSFNLAPTAEGTASQYTGYPSGLVSFDGEVMTIVLGVGAFLPECSRASTHQVQVIRLGDQPVALVYTPIDDTCVGRLADLRSPLIWVAH